MTVTTQLHHLEEADLVHLAQSRPELEYLFRHALVQEAAYHSLLKADRAHIHQVAGRTLEQIFAEQQDELAPVLAHHFLAAGDHQRALTYFSQAAEHALATFANREAERHYRQALALLPEGDPNLLTQLGVALVRQDRYSEAIPIWQEARQQQEQASNDDAVARLYALMLQAIRDQAYVTGANRANVLDFCQEALAALSDRPSTPGLAVFYSEAAKVLWSRGQKAHALERGRQALQIAESFAEPLVQANALMILWGYLQHDQAEQSVAHLQHALILAEAAGDLAILQQILYLLGIRSAELGQTQAAWGYMQRAADAIRRLGTMNELVEALDVVAILAWQLGEWESLEAAVAEAEKIIQRNSFVVFQTIERRWRVLRSWIQGDYEEALSHFQALYGFCQQEGYLPALRDFLSDFTEMLLQLNEVQLAETLIQNLRSPDKVNIRYIVIEHNCPLISLYIRQGKLSQARDLLAETQAEAERRSNPLEKMYLPLVIARLAAAEQRWSAAHAAYGQAIRLQRQIEIRWYIPFWLEEWGDVSLQQPETAPQAQALWQESLALFQAMNLPKHAARLEQRLAQVAQPPETGPS
jgi:tetratricopeptide (TPR) repeat protein